MCAWCVGNTTIMRDWLIWVFCTFFFGGFAEAPDTSRSPCFEFLVGEIKENNFVLTPIDYQAEPWIPTIYCCLLLSAFCAFSPLTRRYCFVSVVSRSPKSCPQTQKVLISNILFLFMAFRFAYSSVNVNCFCAFVKQRLHCDMSCYDFDRCLFDSAIV